MTSLAEAALKYAEAGYRVFPCWPESKKPACKWSRDATTDPEQIAKWWQANPDFNIAIAFDEDTSVIDVDDGGYWPDGPDDVMVETPKNGYHLYYRGQLPVSVSKLAPKVDTRGKGGYALAPPSRANGGEYKFWRREHIPEKWELPELDPEIAARLAPSAGVRETAPPLENVDTDRAKEKFRSYLERHTIPYEGDGSDYATFKAIQRGLDLGLSVDDIADAIEAATLFDRPWIEEKLVNAEKYRQNGMGCDAPIQPDAQWEKIIEWAHTEGATERPAQAQIGDWIPRRPRDPKDIPEIEFWDEDKFLPKVEGGCIGIIYGQSSNHKTNTTLSILHATQCENILYCAGEGIHSVEKERIPARQGLKDRLMLLPRVPLLRLASEVDNLIAGCEAINWRPEIVVLDTLATTLAGEDDNSSVAAAYLTDNGPIGRIKNAFGCCVICIAHSGKDVSKGVRGSSAFEANADFVVEVTADKQARAIQTKLKKSRMGYDDLSAYWGYEAVGVPVPVKISQQEYQRRTKKEAENRENNSVRLAITSCLQVLGLHDWRHGLTRAQLIDQLTRDELGPKPEDVEGARDWNTSHGRWGKSVDAAKGAKWALGMTDSQALPGAPTNAPLELRWFLPKQF